MQIIPISKDSDLIDCLPIKEQIKNHGDVQIKETLLMALSKCAVSLSIELNQLQLETLVEDLVDVYQWDSIEDIIEALKKGRQGQFGKTFGKLDMTIIREWMNHQLSIKADQLERQHGKNKNEIDEEVFQVDYDAYRKRMQEEKQKKTELSDEQKQYNQFKAEYYANKKQ